MKTINDLIIKLNETIGHRFENIDSVNAYISNFLGFNVWFSPSTMDLNTVDYKIIVNVILDDDTELYIDLLYRTNRIGFIYIQGYDLDGQYRIDDYTKRIVK